MSTKRLDKTLKQRGKVRTSRDLDNRDLNREERRKVRAQLRELKDMEFPYSSNLVFTMDKFGSMREYYIDENKWIKESPDPGHWSERNRVNYKPLKNWLKSHIGKPWNDVYRKLKALPDNEVIMEYVDNLVELDWPPSPPKYLCIKNPADYEYYLNHLFGFFVIDGVLTYRKPTGVMHRNRRPPEYLLNKWKKRLLSIAKGRRVYKYGNDMFWMIPIERAIKDSATTVKPSFSIDTYVKNVNRKRELGIENNPAGYRQGNKFSNSELKFWQSIPTYIRNYLYRMLEYSPSWKTTDSNTVVPG